MKNIFEGAKFGDKFITRDGRKAIVINLTHHFQGITMALTIEGDKDAFYRFYHEDGIAKKEAGDTDAVDIVGKWKEPVDEEKLDKLAVEYENKMYGYSVILGDDIKTDQSNQQNIIDIHDAFIAGYRKAKVE